MDMLNPTPSTLHPQPSTKPKLLIVDDDESIRAQMKWALAQEYDILLAVDGEEALQAVERNHPPLVTLDLGLPPHPEDTKEGLRLLDQILQHDPAIKVIIITGNTDRAAALSAIDRGAHDFFTKPINIDELKAILKRAYYVHTLESENERLHEQLECPAFAEMIGPSQKMQDIFVAVRKVATTDIPVLVTGDSGTGKELIARAIHNHSVRKNKPFIPINCGAIPENLIESELFGHEKGSFTGAYTQRKGRVELAEGGTLFLDEIGELSQPLQVKLLRFLQDHKIERVGGRETLEVDCRIIAATNRDIKNLVTAGQFREDLYFRLAVVTIKLPPLRERGEDVILLAKAFLHKFGRDKGSQKTFSHEAIEAINSYDWPGNVRELENRIHGAITLAEGAAIYPNDLGLGESQGVVESLVLKEARENLDRKLIHTAIFKHNGNISRAADELGLSRPTLHHLIKKYKIKLEKGV